MQSGCRSPPFSPRINAQFALSVHCSSICSSVHYFKLNIRFSNNKGKWPYCLHCRANIVAFAVKWVVFTVRVWDFLSERPTPPSGNNDLSVARLSEGIERSLILFCVADSPAQSRDTTAFFYRREDHANTGRHSQLPLGRGTSGI